MANVLSNEKREQVLVLGRLGWPLRRIEDATGVRRETASAYLKAAGIAVRSPGRWGRRGKTGQRGVHRLDRRGKTGQRGVHRLRAGIGGDGRCARVAAATGRAPAASACEPYRELIVDGAGARPQRRRDLPGPGHAARLRGEVREREALRAQAAGRRKSPEPCGVIETAPGEEAQVDYGEGPMIRDAVSGKYRRSRLFVLTLGYSRKAVRLLTMRSSSRIWAELHERSFRRLGGAVRVRRARQSSRGRAQARHLRPRAESTLSRRPPSLRRRRAARARARSGSQGQGRVGDRPHAAHAAEGPALRDSRGSAGLPRPLGADVGRHAHPRNDQAAGGSDVRRGASGAAAAARRAVSLLRVGQAHRASRRTRRGRWRVLRGAARTDRLAHPGAVGRARACGCSIRGPGSCCASTRGCRADDTPRACRARPARRR